MVAQVAEPTAMEEEAARQTVQGIIEEQGLVFGKECRMDLSSSAGTESSDQEEIPKEDESGGASTFSHTHMCFFCEVAMGTIILSLEHNQWQCEECAKDSEYCEKPFDRQGLIEALDAEALRLRANEAAAATASTCDDGSQAARVTDQKPFDSSSSTSEYQTDIESDCIDVVEEGNNDTNGCGM